MKTDTYKDFETVLGSIREQIYFSPVDDPSEIDLEYQDVEISARFLVDPETDTAQRWSWGVDMTNENVEAHFTVTSHTRRESLQGN